MISSNMPIVASNQGWTPMLDESPDCLVMDNNNNFYDLNSPACKATDNNSDKTFFDFAHLDNSNNNSSSKEQAVPASVIEVEDFNFSMMEGIEDGCTIIIDSGNLRSLGLTLEGVEGEEEVEEVVEEGTAALGVAANGNIPTTALEMAYSGETLEVVPEPQLLQTSASVLSANLPAPLGTVTVVQAASTPASYPHSDSCITSPSPFHPPSAYPHPPSTPSCYSTCSDDVASTSSGQMTPDGIGGVTSGEDLLIPVTSDSGIAAAALTALETCSLTPLIKEELKYTIQSRRLAAGKPELVLDTASPVRVRKVVSYIFSFFLSSFSLCCCWFKKIFYSRQNIGTMDRHVPINKRLACVVTVVLLLTFFVFVCLFVINIIQSFEY